LSEGTVVVDFDYRSITGKIVPLEKLSRESRHIDDDWGITLATGCFDLLHVGHVRLLGMAKERFPEHDLIVGINSDQSVKPIKGASRPFIPAEIRAELLAALEFVSYVTIFDGADASEVLRLMRPNIWIKGSDYRAENLPEAALLEEWGGALEILPVSEGWSTSNVVARIRGTYRPKVDPAGLKPTLMPPGAA
jgi:rfaE bifunctional protein nucleotidyltransferase chain/domain